jgi:hypothetical protein
MSSPEKSSSRIVALAHKCTRVAGGTGLAELSDASHFHDRGFLLPLCKARGLSMIRVDSNKSLAILVKQGNLPVMVFSPFVFPEWCAFSRFHSCPGSHLTPVIRGLNVFPGRDSTIVAILHPADLYLL